MGVSDADPDFEEFVRAEGSALVRFAFLLSGDEAGAHDLVQSALTTAFLRWSSIDAAKAGAYVRRCIVNGHRAAWRSWGRRVLLGDRVADGAGGDPYSAVDERSVLSASLRALPYRRRLVVVCRYYLGLTERETSDLTGMSLGTVKSHAHRGLQELRRSLRDSSEDETEETVDVE